MSVARAARPRRSAILVTRDERGRVLLVRQRGGTFAGEWLLPGGGVEDGESFEDALRREVREETGLEVRGPRAIARYDVRSDDFHGEVQMFAGRVSGEARSGPAGEEVRWWTVRIAEAHPVLLRELSDAGMIEVDPAAIAQRCAAAGIRVTAL